jgi:hypothetical protein
MQPYNSFHPQAYTGYSSAYTPSQTPTVDGTPHSVAPVQQLDSASTAAAQKSKDRKRKRHDEEQDGDDEDDEDDEAKKKAKAKAKAEEGAKTKRRKDQDKKDRLAARKRRDIVAARIFNMATRNMLPAERVAFQHEWRRLERYTQIIDGDVEEYIWWNGVRPERRGRDHAVPERSEEDWEA